MYTVTAPQFAKYADQFTDHDELCHLMMVANFLENEQLLELLSAKLAVILANKTVQEVRDFFNINHPFESAEQEERVRKENEEAIEIYNLNDD